MNCQFRTMLLALLLASIILSSEAATASHRIQARGLKLDRPLADNKAFFPAATSANQTSFLARLFPFPVIQAATANSLNSSVSFTVPLFSLATNARTFDLTQLGIPQGSSNLLVLLAVSTVVIGIAVIFLPPFIGVLNNLNNQAAGRSINGGGISSFMTNGLSDILYTLADNPLSGFPGLDPSECLKRSICEAHNDPSRYGWIAFPFQLFFPPYNGNQRDDDPSSLSKFQLAARYGKTDNANCGLQYHGCFFNPLSFLQKIVSWIFGKWTKR